jgi:diguanylate cyclase (GGDEF)-like protein
MKSRDAIDYSTLAASMAHASFGLALFGPDDSLRYCNEWFERAYGVSLKDRPTWESMMRTCYSARRGVLIETDDIDAWLAVVRTKYRQRPSRSFQSDFCDGRWVWVTETLQPNGWLLMSVNDVSPLKALERELEGARDDAVRISMKDPLTDLSNRRFIMGHLGEMLAGARAIRCPLSLAMLDIDHFKQINDNSGHDVGDAVLRHFADRLRQQLRPSDAVGRIGGEEFLFVLQNTSLRGACDMLARVRGLVTASLNAHAEAIPPYTFSAGIALASVEDSVDTLFRRADQALFKAKRGGRDQDWAVDSMSMRL